LRSRAAGSLLAQATPATAPQSGSKRLPMKAEGTVAARMLQHQCGLHRDGGRWVKRRLALQILGRVMAWRSLSTCARSTALLRADFTQMVQQQMGVVRLRNGAHIQTHDVARPLQMELTGTSRNKRPWAGLHIAVAAEDFHGFAGVARHACSSRTWRQA
jgi:hypothetical protein